MGSNISMTARCAERINEIITSQPEKSALRISVLGGGCSGFQYEFDLDSSQTEEDIVVERDGAKVLIDQVSLVYLLGSEIDFVDDLIGAQFAINNPNATSSCGCGTSFSI